MAISALAKKLRLQNAIRVLILNAPDGFLDLLGDFPDEVKVEEDIRGKYDYALLFVKNREELDQFIDKVLVAIAYDAIFWVSYPKGSSGVKTDLNRDKIWEAMKEKNIRPVTQVSIDGVWSAMRFRPYEAVGK